jgi:hypothetical protein
MVDLPEVPVSEDISRKPQTAVTPGEVQAPYQMLANTLDKASAAAETVATRYGEQAGEQAVGEANGKPFIAKAPLIGPASDAYARAAKIEYMTKMTPAISQSVEQMRIDAKGDPHVLSESLKKYNDTMLQNTPPELRPAIGRTIADQTTSAVKQTMAQDDVTTRTNALQGMQEELKRTNEERITLARQGLDTPEQRAAYDQKVKDSEAIVDLITSDPRNGYNAQRAGLEKQQARDADTAQQKIGDVIRTYQTKKNKVEAQRALYAAFWTDPEAQKLGLTARQRDAAVAEGLHALEGVSVEEKEELKNYHAELNSWESEIIKAPNNFSLTHANDLKQRAAALGDQASVDHIEGLTAQIDWMKLQRQQDPKSSAQTLGAIAEGYKPELLSPGKMVVLDAIAHGEVAGGGFGMDPVTGQPIRTGYGETVGGKSFKPGEFPGQHPYETGAFPPYVYPPGSRWAGQISTAAGRGQETLTTYRERVRKYGIPGMSEEAQDMRSWLSAADLYKTTGAWKSYPGATGDLEEDVGKFGSDPGWWMNAATPALKKEWTSVPGGSQPNDHTRTWVQNAIARSQGTGVAPPAPINLAAADAEMHFTPQEKDFYQLHLDRLRSPNERIVDDQGNVSTLLQMTVDHEGKTYNIPSIWGGKIVSVDDAVKNVEKIGWDKFPSYNTPEEAEARYQRMHKYMDKDAEAFKTAQQEIKEHPVVRGTPIASLPATQQRLFQSIAVELQQNAAKNAKAAIEDIDRRLKNNEDIGIGTLRDAVTLAQRGGQEDQLQHMSQLLDSAEMAKTIMTPEDKAAFKNQLEQRKAAGMDTATTQLYEGAWNNIENHQKALGTSPVDAAVAQGDYRKVDFNTADPNQTAANFQSRDQIVQKMRDTHGTFVSDNPSVLSKEDGISIGGKLRSGPIQEAKNIALGMGTMSEGAYYGTLNSDDMKSSVLSMAGSNNPERMTTGMMMLDKARRINPVDFKHDFGEAALKRLDAWTDLKDKIDNPQDLVKQLNMPDDPQQKRIYEQVKADVDKEVGKMTGEESKNIMQGGFWGRFFATQGHDILRGIIGQPEQAAYLQSDFVDYYKAMRARGLDAQAAAEKAGDYVKTLWTQSGVNNGAITRNAPELMYPQVGGSHDWIKDQVMQEARGILGQQTPIGPGASPSWSIAGVMADPQTVHEKTAGLAPSYMIFINYRGQLMQLHGPDGSDRFAFDQKAALDKFNRDVEARERVTGLVPQPGAFGAPTEIGTLPGGGPMMRPLGPYVRSGLSRLGGITQPGNEPVTGTPVTLGTRG